MQALSCLCDRRMCAYGSARWGWYCGVLPKGGPRIGRSYQVSALVRLLLLVLTAKHRYLVYNLRKRGGDSADKYFKSTEMIAGVKDMRFQALMPDILHWLGITKIDNMISMSDMKYNAIVDSGIPILKRYDLPEHLIPPDSRVEIDAKIAAGYFTSGKQITEADLYKTVGRTWEETDH
ncbi:Uracil-regulated protein 1 [Ceratobasidium sp. 394]|nr:Uracil-regulated protein 1 [Ceratobasidium sp. 394]